LVIIVLLVHRWLVGAGSVLLVALAGYGLWQAAQNAREGSLGTILGLVAIVGLIGLLASNLLPRYMGRLRRGLVLAGALMLGTFAAYVLVTSAGRAPHDVGAAFTAVGMVGLLLVLAGTTLQRVWP